MVTCTREKDQTYIAVHRDIAPQLLIQNLSDVPIAVGQAIQSNLLSPTTNDYVKKVRMFLFYFYHMYIHF